MVNIRKLDLNLFIVLEALIREAARPMGDKEGQRDAKSTVANGHHVISLRWVVAAPGLRTCVTILAGRRRRRLKTINQGNRT